MVTASPLIRYLLPLLLGFLAVVAIGCGEEQPPPKPTLTPIQLEGKRVFQARCAACHSLAEETTIVGPSFKGLATRAGNRVADQTASEYLLMSIIAPDAYLVEGFENLMPVTLGKSMSGEEVDAVVEYLLTLD